MNLTITLISILFSGKERGWSSVIRLQCDWDRKSVKSANFTIQRDKYSPRVSHNESGKIIVPLTLQFVFFWQISISFKNSFSKKIQKY